MISLSYSTLKIYLDCKRCFWLQFNKNIKRPEGIFSSLPMGMDSIIKDYFNTFRQKGKMPPILADKIEGKPANIALNHKFKDEKNGLIISGKLDECIELKDGTFIPLDHKTRGSLPSNIEYSYDYYKLQADTYTFLLKKNNFKTQNFTYIVYYSPKKGDLGNGIPFDIELHKIDTDPDEVYNLFIEARNSLCGSLPDAGSDCQYCNYLKLRSSEE